MLGSKHIIALVLVAIMIGLAVYFLWTSYGGTTSSSASFGTRCLLTSVKMNIYSSHPRLAKIFMGGKPQVKKLKEVATGWKEFEGIKGVGDLIFDRAQVTWNCLNTDFPFLKQEEANTLTTFTDFVEFKKAMKVGDIANYISTNYTNESEEMKIGFIAPGENNLAKPLDPGTELKGNYSMNVLFSEWNFQKDPSNPKKCVSKEMEKCYLMWEARNDSIDIDLYRGGRFQILSKKQEWEGFSATQFVHEYVCEILDISGLRDVLTTIVYLTSPKFGLALEGLQSIEMFYKEKDFPCPYYRTKCGYLNKSLACCEDKIFVCMHSGGE